MNSGVTYVKNKPYNHSNGFVTSTPPIGKGYEARKDYQQAQRAAHAANTSFQAKKAHEEEMAKRAAKKSGKTH